MGLKAYEKAGGVVRRDLFGEEDEVWLDATVVRELVTAKLDKCAERLRKEGMPWVHVSPELDYASRAAYGRVKTVLRDATAEEQQTLESIVAERSRLEGEINDVQDDEERLAALEERMGELDHEEEALNEKRRVLDPAQQALAGAVVSIGRDGKVLIERDVLKPEDANRFAQAEKERLRAARQTGPRVHSAALVRRLTAQRTLALQATLAERPDVALVALTHRLLLRALPVYGRGGNSAVQVNASRAELGAYTEELAGCPAEKALRARCAALEAQLPEDPAQIFGWLMERPQTELLSILACCVALTVDAVQADERPSAADEIARAAGLDMHAWWTPSAANYLSHISRAQILDIVREAVSPEVAEALSRLKKAPLVQAAEKRLDGTGWLPRLLKTGA